MLINPQELIQNLDRLEEIEKVSLRLVTQAIYDYRTVAQEIFQEESDLVADIGEDITREALDRLGMSKIDQRLFGKVDYKRARYLFHPGKLPTILSLKGESYLTTTLFVKYSYEAQGAINSLKSITIAAVPNGMLQERYNPSAQDTIWIAGRNAPTLGEEFRVRLSFARLKQKATWRVQKISLTPDEFHWGS